MPNNLGLHYIPDPRGYLGATWLPSQTLQAVLRSGGAVLAPESALLMFSVVLLVNLEGE